MTIFILCISLVVALIVAGAVLLEPWKSRMHIINAEWLDEPDRFSLITRWGQN